MASNTFSVNSLLNASARTNDTLLTPQSSVTDVSRRSTGTAGSSDGSPLADLADDIKSPPMGLASSPRRALQPRVLTPVHIPPIAIPNASSVASHAASNGTSPQIPGGLGQLVRPPLTPVAGNSSSSLQQHFRLRDYRHHIYRHQARTPYEAPLSSPPHMAPIEAQPSGAPLQSPHEPHTHRHQLPAVDYRYWPYPPPQPNIGARVAPQGPAGAPYFVHSTPPNVTSLHPAAPGLQGIHTPWRRERRSKACLRCHTKKIKCEGEGMICDGCKQAGCECKWVEMKKRGPKPKKKDQNHPQAENGAENNAGAKLDKDIANGVSADGARPATSCRTELEATAQNTGLTAVSPAAVALKAEAAISPPLPTEAVSAPEIAAQAPRFIGSAVHAPAGDMGIGAASYETATMEQVLQRFRSDHVPADTREAVVFYFDYLYGRTPVIHPATFVRRVAFGLVDELLIDAMKANTARLVMKRTGRHIDVKRLTTSLHKRLLAGLDRLTMDYVCAVLLTASQSGGESRFTTYNSLTSLAASLVMRLGWHTLDLGRGMEEVTWEEWVQLEQKRRMFWAVYHMDSYQSLMSDRPMTIDKSRICIATPGSDYTWDDVTMPQIMHWPTRHQPDIRHDMVIRMGALSYAFIELCSLLAIVAQINDFVWEVRVNVLVHLPGREWATDIPFMKVPAPPALRAAREPVGSLFEYAEFRRLHDSLCEWRDGLIRAEDMRGEQCAPLSDISQMGSLENRRYAMRVRFFCLRCYFSAFLLILHGANRPSFFDPARQLPKRVGGLVAAVAVSETEEDRVLRSMMSMAFSELLNDGFLAYDVVDESWDICLREIYSLLDHLERNSDIPIDRCDSSISFCLFSSITVLVRQIRMCRERLAHGGSARPGVRDEMLRAVSTLRRMWQMLKDLGPMWGSHDMEKLMRTMQVEEMANATDMFSELKV